MKNFQLRISYQGHFAILFKGCPMSIKDNVLPYAFNSKPTHNSKQTPGLKELGLKVLFYLKFSF